ncbi:hypothetical protein PoB_003332800 [Plakobranchus ocellatus]|uniref:Uncharacterized protein n=1 Tax=Plakobranchus ocellatus TaxID=259542 RepID=A0AAV4AJX4_9GAST|nr:hypothetical protein PoB_003332800 [Plakobranchus ocellatus]
MQRSGPCEKKNMTRASRSRGHLGDHARHCTEPVSQQMPVRPADYQNATVPQAPPYGSQRRSSLPRQISSRLEDARPAADETGLYNPVISVTEPVLFPHKIEDDNPLFGRHGLFTDSVPTQGRPGHLPPISSFLTRQATPPRLLSRRRAFDRLDNENMPGQVGTAADPVDPSTSATAKRRCIRTSTTSPSPPAKGELQSNEVSSTTLCAEANPRCFWLLIVFEESNSQVVDAENEESDSESVDAENAESDSELVDSDIEESDSDLVDAESHSEFDEAENVESDSEVVDVENL